MKFDIDVHSIDNAALLIRNKKFAEYGSSAIHSTLHTDLYHRSVFNKLKHATSREEAIKILDRIRFELEHNIYQY